MNWRLGPLVLFVLVFATPVLAQDFAFGGDVAENVSAIRANGPDLREDAFAKMGGSSVESHAFLRCFATSYVDLGEHTELEGAIEHFGTRKRNSFSRTSLAAGVSWNLRYVLGGRPAKFRQEVAATDPRWALVLFGGNDSQNRNERIYARRLVYLVEELVELGVVPVLGSAAPRRSQSKDRWVQRFNAITEAVATHWQLPYIDYYAAMVVLPRKGLAGDGVHPNVYGRGGVRAACQLTDEGLRYGNNARNLLTLQALDSLKELARSEQVLIDTLPLHSQHPLSYQERIDERYRIPVLRSTGPVVRIDSFPFSAVFDKARLDELEAMPVGCPEAAEGSRGIRVTMDLADKQRLRAVAIDLEGGETRLYWVRSDETGARCLKRRSQSIEVAPGPGTWDLLVEVRAGAADGGDLLLLLSREPK